MPKAEHVDAQDDLPLERFLTYRLLRVHSKLNTQAIRLLKDIADLPLAHWRVLAMIATNEGATAGRIARLSRIDKGQLSRSIKALVADGLIVSTGEESDHRQHYLTLTGKGRTLYEKTVPRMRARQRYLLGHLTPVEHDALFGARQTRTGRRSHEYPRMSRSDLLVITSDEHPARATGRDGHPRHPWPASPGPSSLARHPWLEQTERANGQPTAL